MDECKPLFYGRVLDLLTTLFCASHENSQSQAGAYTRSHFSST